MKGSVGYRMQGVGGHTPEISGSEMRDSEDLPTVADLAGFLVQN